MQVKMYNTMKMYALLLVFAMGLLFAKTENVYAAKEVASGQCGESAYWSLDDAGVMTISGSGEMWDMLDNEPAPSDYHERSWEAYIDDIKSVVFESGIKNVGEGAFADCKNLKNVSFCNTITGIDYLAFSYCSSLENFTLPDSLTYLRQQAFWNCTSITSVAIPDMVTFLDASIFDGCTSLKYAYIGGSTEAQGYVTGNCMFRNCTSLEKIEVSEDNLGLKSVDGVLFDKDGKTLMQYPAGKKDTKYAIPKGTTDIFQFAIEGAVYLEELQIPETVTVMANDAVRDCPRLKYLEIPASVEEMAEDIGLFCYSLEYIKNNSSVDMEASTSAGFVWVDVNGKSIKNASGMNVIKANSTAYQYACPMDIEAEETVEFLVGEEKAFPCEVRYWNVTYEELYGKKGGKNLIYTSSDTNILEIKEDGTAIPKKEGTVTVTLKPRFNENEGNIVEPVTCTINVVEKGSAEGTKPESKPNNNTNTNPQNKPSVTKNGLVQEHGEWVYYENGKKVETKTGLVLYSGAWFFVENGKVNNQAVGIVDYDGASFYVAKGRVVTEANGLVQDGKDWYFVSNGQVQKQYTGLAQYDGAWFYVDAGKLDTKLAGYVEYDGGLFYVAAGQIKTKVSGLAQDPNTSKWYYLANGQVQKQHTGLAQYDGAWFYVVKGALAEDYTGYVDYDGSSFYVVNGKVQ